MLEKSGATHYQWRSHCAHLLRRSNQDSKALDNQRTWKSYGEGEEMEGWLGVSHHPAVCLRLLQHREAPGTLPHPFLYWTGQEPHHRAGRETSQVNDC